MARTTFDYGQAKADWLNGLSLKQISEKRAIPYDALVKYAHRKNWTIDKKRVDKAVSATVQAGLEKRATDYTNKLDKLIHAGIDNLAAKPLTELGLKDLDLALGCAIKAAQLARPHYGMDRQEANGNRGVLLQVNVAGSQVRTGYTSSASPEQLANLQRISLDLPASDELAIEQAS